MSYYQPMNVEIAKQDESGNNIAGAKMELYYRNNKISEWVSSTVPEQLFLNPGQYTLKEIAAPNGYEYNADEITFFVDIEQKIVLDGKEVERVVFTNHKTKVLEDVLEPRETESEIKVPNTGENTKDNDIVMYGGIILPIGVGLLILSYVSVKNVGKKVDFKK